MPVKNEIVWKRRQFMAAASAALAMPAVLRGRALAADKPIRVGFVTPQTGPLAFFGEPDAIVAERFKPTAVRSSCW